MLPLLAALPAIFTTVSKVSDLFLKGKEVVEKVTGKPSEASTPDELKEEIESLPPEQQAKWAHAMQQKIELYKVENERLDIEIGRITPELQSKVTAEAASKIIFCLSRLCPSKAATPQNVWLCRGWESL